MRVLVTVLCLLSLCVPLFAENAQSEDDLKLAKLANETQARDFYLAGEAASKNGDLETAIWDWSRALTFKPDSAYTSKRLAQARDQLYKKYLASVSSKADAKDPITAYEQAAAMMPLLPDRKDITERAAKLKSGLNDDQNKALVAYEDGQAALALQDYTKAASSFTTAQTFARDAVCVKDAIARLDALRGKSPESFTVASASAVRLPRLIYIYATWCHYCDKMKPMIDEAKEQYASKLSVVYIDSDKNKAAVQHYGVHGYPCVIFLDSNGAETYRIPGYVQKEDFVRILARQGYR